MDLGIAGKWALVGGASKGLGWGCARALALEGVNVVMVARGAEVLNKTVDDLRAETGGRVQLIAVAQDITTGRSAIWQAPGGPGKNFDIVVTNAGGPPPGDFREWDREAWLKAIDGNMLTPIELIKATVDGMAARGFGRIVNITSSAVKSPIDVLGLSNGARSGLTGFVAGTSRSKIAAQGVTINNLLPGYAARHGAKAGQNSRRNARHSASANSGWAIRQRARVRCHLRLFVQPARGLYDGPERVGRWRGLPGNLLSHQRPMKGPDFTAAKRPKSRR
jgi:3-oxoacyl-[acyl-carrier protein] reductase